ncbi:MAG: hypothetical protein NTZ78_08815 [Candidatus Aureabacteria bacterium]|nr:hypothetical protein [Candidatus Auribacterota bacterium]
MKKSTWLLLPLLLAGTVFGQTLANLPDVNLLLQGAKVYAQDPESTYLGSITNELDQDSIFNWLGPYGSTLSQTSLWNELSPYGIETGKYSAYNELSKTPPKIVKGGKVLGYITKNQTIYNRISPWQLKSIKDQLFQ